ncbi:hypothetical protein [Campylobacter concisus]|uniref:hypothetical protein n=1 Tax=Campylobacter concisus TaxID=199 RepID=UPI0018C24639|nr:hypothetical protein [Campylobacter concisus]QPH87264.1 hypothetical protein CVT15_00315 [Campylobacter concisus]
MTKRLFKTLIKSFCLFFYLFLKKSQIYLQKNEKNNYLLKKIIAQTIELFTQANDKALDQADAKAFNDLVPELSQELGTRFDTLHIEEKKEEILKAKEPKVITKTEPTYHQNVSFSSNDISTFNDREFREYFINLSLMLFKE